MSAINALMKEPVIPFVWKKLEKDIPTVTLQHTVTVNINVRGMNQQYREKRTAKLLIAEDDDLELLIRLGIAFVEACDLNSLALTAGMMFIEFWPYNNQITKLLKAIYKWVQYQAGVSFPILENTQFPLPHLESKWIKAIHTFLHKINGIIIIVS